MSSTVNNGAAGMPSPPDAANGFPQPGASSGTWPRAEEELRAAEPGLVKRAHREILDHERKRRVELKCMELQEMMEEQGYSEEEIRQKVGTFRQMLMEKEGVLTREDRPGAHIVAETPRRMDGLEPGLEYPPFDEDDGPVDCDCPVACYRGHRGYRTKHWSSSSASPPPKKKKKKKGSHRRSRKKRRLESECSCGSASPLRKKKKGVKKHRRDRSDSGSRRKRRYRSRSLKSKRKERNKERKRPHTESPGRRSHHHSSVSSHCPSMTSHYSDSGSPSRLSPKHRDDGRKTGNQRSSGSRSPSPSGGSGWGSPQQNGGSRQRSGAHGGRPGSAHSPPDEEVPLYCLVRPGPATRWPPRPRRPRVGKTVRARALRRRRRAAGAARREGRPGVVAGGGGGGDRDPRPTRPAAGDAGVPSPRRPGARPARSAGLTPAASRVAASRVQGPNRARREATAVTGKGQRSDPRARGPQAPRHLQARTAGGVARRGTAHHAAPAPIRGPGAPAAHRPNPAHAPQTKGPAAPASPRRPRNLLAGTRTAKAVRGMPRLRPPAPDVAPAATRRSESGAVTRPVSWSQGASPVPESVPSPTTDPAPPLPPAA
ncbi:serine/arginine repetitive matrix protein 3 isoform X3 [Peromyscus californicus insignis]|uniref:serine/arginine repetitive matrix protein 3 isoform X3 n=1 Tax=Peromyscus californicus insignis TaxID=564181 RepID=UPI0022A6F0C5|nr:serine/arginine repetitive matrix protein 3 isoform X3 [Peromyscus californicus insignis]